MPRLGLDVSLTPPLIPVVLLGAREIWAVRRNHSTQVGLVAGGGGKEAGSTSGLCCVAGAVAKPFVVAAALCCVQLPGMGCGFWGSS